MEDLFVRAAEHSFLHFHYQKKYKLLKKKSIAYISHGIITTEEQIETGLYQVLYIHNFFSYGCSIMRGIKTPSVDVTK